MGVRVNVYLAGGDLDEEEHVDAFEEDRVDGEEVARQDAAGLGGEELLPGRAGAAGRRVDAGPVQDVPYGAGSDLVAEVDQFTVDGESAWGAVAGFPRLRFPRPLSEPGVRLSPHRALHGVMPLV